MTTIIAVGLAAVIGLFSTRAVGKKKPAVEYYDGPTLQSEFSRLDVQYKAARSDDEIDAAVRGLAALYSHTQGEAAAALRSDLCFKAMAANMVMDECMER